MKSQTLFTLSLLAACALGLQPITTFAKESTTAKENKAEKAEQKEAAGKAIPYTGTVTKVDAASKTITLKNRTGGRAIMVNDATKITNDGKEATLSDIKEGETIRGQATKSGDTTTAVSVMIGAKKKEAAGDDANKGSTTEANTQPATAKEGTAPVKAARGTDGVTSPGKSPKSGAGSAPSSSAGPGVNGVSQPGGQAPAGAKKN